MFRQPTLAMRRDRVCMASVVKESASPRSKRSGCDLARTSRGVLALNLAATGLKALFTVVRAGVVAGWRSILILRRRN